MVKYFRNVTAENIVAPFSFRPLAPYLASFLPFDAETSLNTLNAIAFTISILILQQLINGFEIGSRAKNLLLLFFIFSFPAAYYTTVGYLDIWVVLFTMVTVYLFKYYSLYQALFFYLLLLFICTFLKESVIVSVGFVTAFIYSQRKNLGKTLIILSAILSIWILANTLTRQVIPVKNVGYSWVPSLKSIEFNLSRPRALPSLLLSIGAQGFFYSWLVVKKRVPLNSPYFVGFLSFAALWVYSFLTAYANGRFIWPGMIFSTLGIAHYFSPKKAILINKQN
ncbi:MAG: hypothetical protein JXQ87_12705 [Bacteroidia bacterium]